MRQRDPIWRLFVLACVLIIAMAGVTLAYFHGSTAIDRAKAAASQAQTAASDAKAAAADAKKAVDCLNNVLADRNGPGARDNAAHAAFAHEAKRWVKSLNALFTVKPGTPQAKKAVKSFKDESVTFQIVITTLAATLAADQKIRDANPLGQC